MKFIRMLILMQLMAFSKLLLIRVDALKVGCLAQDLGMPKV